MNKETVDSEKLADAVSHIAAQSHDLLEQYLSHHSKNFDPLGVSKHFLDLTASLMKQPEKLVQAQMNAWGAYMDLWLNMVHTMTGKETEPVVSHNGDRRFKHDAWTNNPFFDYIRQSYLIAANTVQSVVADVDGLDKETARKVEFYTKQIVDAMSPSNFVLTNPEVIQKTIETRGDNLLQGLQHMLEDFDPQAGHLKIKMTDTKAFELGKNIATTPGKVIFQNELMQLIQYSPSTEEVNERPLLIIPPWINKFYVLDLQPKNSMIKWLVDQGHTVFVISWINPDASLSDTDFQDYVFKGPLAALAAITQATGMKEINAVGYCIGGTLLAATLAYMEAKNDRRIVSATFFVSMIDFSEPGDLGVFVDEGQLQKLESEMEKRGYHEGKEMAMTFNLLRANDLIWSFYVNNYLLGKQPMPFDLLYWNADATRMPAKMHSTYLRTMYLENRFKDPGGMTVSDVPIDVSKITTPSYFISTEDDHIAPWKSTYLGAQLFSGPVKFVLGKSGHIAGIINPPAANKYGYYLGPEKLDMDAEAWHEQTQSHDGSWWTDWNEWLTPFAGEKVSARIPGEGELKSIEDAPGSFVKVKA